MGGGLSDTAAMQPESKVFLPIVIDALDRLLDPALDEANKKRYAYVARRALVQMRVREERVPTLLAKFEPEIRSLIAQTATWLGQSGDDPSTHVLDSEARWNQLT